MWIVIDTNIFYKDFRINKSLDLLFKKLENLSFTLHIPEIIVQETINKYKEQRQAYISEFESGVQGLKTLTTLDINTHIEPERLERDLIEYESYLRGKIQSNGEIVPYLNHKVESLVERALARKKPFNANGEGFRDAIIWESILNLATRRDCEGIIFITENIKDFAEHNQLHPQLVDDLRNNNLDAAIVSISTSLKEFITNSVLPALNDLQGIRDAIINGAHPEIDLNEIAETFLWDLISGYEIDPDCLPGYAEDNPDTTISAGTSDYSILWDSLLVKRLTKTELLITVSFELECELDVFIPRWDIYDETIYELGFYISNPDWNETYALASISLPFRITLRFAFNEENGDVISADIIDAECLNIER